MTVHHLRLLPPPDDGPDDGLPPGEMMAIAVGLGVLALVAVAVLVALAVEILTR